MRAWPDRRASPFQSQPGALAMAQHDGLPCRGSCNRRKACVPNNKLVSLSARLEKGASKGRTPNADRPQLMLLGQALRRSSNAQRSSFFFAQIRRRRLASSGLLSSSSYSATSPALWSKAGCSVVVRCALAGCHEALQDSSLLSLSCSMNFPWVDKSRARLANLSLSELFLLRSSEHSKLQ